MGTEQKTYACLSRQSFFANGFSIVPIRFEDRNAIMQWRNEQIYHLRQIKPLTREKQDQYFNDVVSSLFSNPQPDQLLFSYLEGGNCIGYGGLVHMNWLDKNAEISFIMDTSLESKSFSFHWSNFLSMIEEVSFQQLGFHKIYVWAFDLRPHLYTTLKANQFFEDARLKDHVSFKDGFVDVVVHSKIRNL